MAKIIFFDVDGTLVDQFASREFVPESTKEAIKLTRKKGNLVYLCTGRSKPEIYPHIMEVGIDGIIGAGGSFIEINGNMLETNYIPRDSVEQIQSFFEENNFDYYLESNSGLFASKNLIPRLEKLIYGDLKNDPSARQTKEEQPNHFIELLLNVETASLDDINKICFLEGSKTWQEIYDRFHDKMNVIPCTVSIFGDESGELSMHNIDKESSINKLLNHLNISPKDAYAYGDGNNDIAMFKSVGHGIAVGNATDKLKASADEVCDRIDNDRIYKSMKLNKLI